MLFNTVRCKNKWNCAVDALIHRLQTCFFRFKEVAVCLCDPVLRCSGVPTLPTSPRRWPGCCRRSPESKTVCALFLSSHAALSEPCKFCKNRFLRFTCKIDSDSGTLPRCCRLPIALESRSGQFVRGILSKCSDLTLLRSSTAVVFTCTEKPCFSAKSTPSLSRTFSCAVLPPKSN